MEKPAPKDTALLIHIEHSKPIELSDFTTTLNSIASLYTSYVKENGGSDEMAKSRLYVEKVEEGCIDIYLCEMVAATLIPFLENANTIFDFATHLKAIVNYFCHHQGTKPVLTPEKCNDISGIFSINVHDNNGQTAICAVNMKDVSNQFENCTFNFTESNSAQNQVRQEREELTAEAPKTKTFERCLMTVYQVHADQSRDKGNKAVIESISTRRLPLLFNSDELKHDILFSDDNPMRKGYFVDGEILSVGGRDVAYNITALHDVIDLE